VEPIAKLVRSAGVIVMEDNTGVALVVVENLVVVAVVVVAVVFDEQDAMVKIIAAIIPIVRQKVKNCIGFVFIIVPYRSVLINLANYTTVK
jgi:hypothetical protein